MKIILRCLIVCRLASPAVGVYECCKPGEVVIYNEYDNVTSVCLDPNLGITTNISIAHDCEDTYIFIQGHVVNFSVTEEEKLDLWKGRYHIDAVDNKSFCIANFTETSGSAWEPAAVMCIEYEDPSNSILLSHCMIVSIIFLALTAFIYVALPELRDLQGKSIINLCISFGTGLTFISVMELVPYEDMDLCAVRGFFAYFFMMASFFWMNSISIQVLRSIRSRTMSSAGWKEFIYYAAYSWGCAALLTICVIVANYHPGDHLIPGFGYDHCWFFSRKEQWAYMYSVMTVLIVANICIFLFTSLMLWRHSFQSTSIKTLRYKFCMCLRLFVVMGVGWIFELAGAAHGQYHVIWIIMDIYNTLQGIFIFLILVVFRRRVIKAMYSHGWLCCIAKPIEKYLGKYGDEEEVVQHTAVMSFEDRGR